VQRVNQICCVGQVERSESATGCDRKEQVIFFLILLVQESFLSFFKKV